MKKITSWFFVALLIMACFMLSVSTFDANDYGGGGDDGGGWDWGGGDSSYDSDSNTEMPDEDVVIMIVFIIVVFAIVFVVSKRMKTKNSSNQTGLIRPSSNEGLHIQLPDRTLQIESIIKGHDTNFSANDFISFVKRMYIDIQTAWCKRDMSPVRVFLHNNLYDTTVKQIQAKINQGVVYHYESMVVNTAYLSSYAKDEQFEYLTVYLNARMIDWQEDEKTGKILRGDKITRWDLRYKMKFMRSTGVLTKEEIAGATEHKCPNCGAPLEATSSGKCEYCNSIVTTGQYSWVLSDFGTIRNDTIDEGVRAD